MALATYVYVPALLLSCFVYWNCPKQRRNCPVGLPLSLSANYENLHEEFGVHLLAKAGCTAPCPSKQQQQGSSLAPSRCNMVTPSGSWLFGVLVLETEVCRCRAAHTATGSSPGPSPSSPSLPTLCHFVHFQDLFWRQLIHLTKT